MSQFKLINIELPNDDHGLPHVTVSYSDGVEQTMCDCPVDTVENRDKFLSDYGDRYEASILASTPVVATNIMDGVGEVITPAKMQAEAQIDQAVL